MYSQLIMHDLNLHVYRFIRIARKINRNNPLKKEYRRFFFYQGIILNIII